MNVLNVNQRTWESHPITDLPDGFQGVRVWIAAARAGVPSPRFIALFNLDDKPATLHAGWSLLGLGRSKLRARNLWDGRELPASDGIEVILPAHGTAIFRVE